MGRVARTVRRGAAFLLCLVLGAATIACTSTSYDCGKLGTVRVGSIWEGFFDGLFDLDSDDEWEDERDDEADAQTTCDPRSRHNREHVHVPGQRTDP